MCMIKQCIGDIDFVSDKGCQMVVLYVSYSFCHLHNLLLATTYACYNSVDMHLETCVSIIYSH